MSFPPAWPPDPPASGGGDVSSVFGRTGAVVAQAGDYDTDEVANASTVPGASTSSALNSLQNAINAIVVPVVSVFGRTGAIVSAVGDYVGSQVNNDSDVTGLNVTEALNELLSLIPSVPVSSVFGRTGAIASAVGDYAASQVNNNSSVVGSSVKDALNTLLGLIPPAAPVSSVYGRTGAVVAVAGDYIAGQVVNNSTVTGAFVSDALDTLKAAIAIITGAYVSSWNGRLGTVVPIGGDYAASAITNDSNVAGANVQTALNNLRVFVGAYASRPAAGGAGRTAWLTDSPTALWLDNGSSWKPYINGLLGVEPPAVAGATTYNSGGTFSATDQNGATRIVGNNDGAAPGQLRGQVFANAASTAFARATFRFTLAGDTTANHVSGVGVILRESGTGKVYVLQLVQDFGNNLTTIAVSTWTSSSARASFTNKGYAVFDDTAPLALRVRRSGTNVLGEVSRDGITWTQVDSRATTSVFTTAPDQAGWQITGINVTPTVDMLSFEQGS